jgi:protease I|tara:strand:- start:75 stop:605 length:531 start_codon:yes stop_codon:yes gene_type:complete
MKAIIISGALAQDHEFIYPFYRVLEAGFELDVCIIGGKPATGILGTLLPPNKEHPVKDIHQVEPKNYDLLILPGGVKAMEKIRQEKKLINFISEFHKLDRVIACICSGVQLLISAKIVKGKNISGYYSLKDDIINAGANYVDEPAVIDSKIVTTAHYKDMGPWMKAVLKFFDEKKR